MSSRRGRACVVAASIVAASIVSSCGGEERQPVATQTQTILVPDTHFVTSTVTEKRGPDDECRDFVTASMNVADALEVLSAEFRGEIDGILEGLRVANINRDWRAAQTLGKRDTVVDNRTASIWNSVGTYGANLDNGSSYSAFDAEACKR